MADNKARQWIPDDDGCVSLARAITLQAILDYTCLRRRRSERGAREKLEELESFFRCSYVLPLAELNGETLLRKLRKGVRLP